MTAAPPSTTTAPSEISSVTRDARWRGGAPRVIQGGMGIAAGGNINPNGVSMFEPIGGTAPAETGRKTINPLAAIGALMLLLHELGEDTAADRVDRGVRFAVSKMASMRAGQMGFSTPEVGDLVLEGSTT